MREGKERVFPRVELAESAEASGASARQAGRQGSSTAAPPTPCVYCTALVPAKRGRRQLARHPGAQRPPLSFISSAPSKDLGLPY